MFDDEPDLPYIKVFGKEVLRWISVANVGGSRMSIYRMVVVWYGGQCRRRQSSLLL